MFCSISPCSVSPSLSAPGAFSQPYCISFPPCTAAYPGCPGQHGGAEAQWEGVTIQSKVFNIPNHQSVSVQQFKESLYQILQLPHQFKYLASTFTEAFYIYWWVANRRQEVGREMRNDVKLPPNIPPALWPFQPLCFLCAHKLTS